MPEEAQPLTVDAARQELEQLQVWSQDFMQRQQQLTGINQRAAFLSGFLAAHETLTAETGQADPLPDE